MGHVFNVPISRNFEHVENVLHEKTTIAQRRKTMATVNSLSKKRWLPSRSGVT